MKRTLFASAITLLCCLSAGTALAGTPRLDRRQAHQEQRIEQGEASGSLTRHEATRLERGQDHLQSMENAAKADGVVTRKERFQLENAADRQSRRIYHQKHDAQHDLNHDGYTDRP